MIPTKTRILSTPVSRKSVFKPICPSAASNVKI
jgi:hypothetical protein